MKKSFLIGILACLSVAVCAQEKMKWYGYWGSKEAGNQIEAQRMVVDPNGNVYVAANFGGEKVAVENKTLVSASTVDKGDAVIIKLDANKNVLWTYPIVNQGTASVKDIALMSDGKLAVIGAFNNKINAAGGTMSLNDENMGEQAIYCLVLNSDGTAAAAWQIAAIAAYPGSISIDASNNVILSGVLDGDATFAIGAEPEGDFQNMAQYFVAKYSSTGAMQWHKFINEASNIGSFNNVTNAVDKAGNVYVSATLTGEVTLAGTTFNAGTANAIIWKYDAAGTEQWAHQMTGTRADKNAAIAVNENTGEVLLVYNHYSEDNQVDGDGDELNNKCKTAGDATQYHTQLVAFAKADGAYKWFYDFGYNSTVGGGGAEAKNIRITDEGVIYVCGTMSGRYGDSTTKIHYTTANFGVTTIDGQNLNHNTNGGGDAFMFVLTRDGKLFNAVRPGGTQTEAMMDIALSPDKKDIYFLEGIQVRDNVVFTCVDNIFDSYTDLSGSVDSIPDRKASYTVFRVLCPEDDGIMEKYTKTYKNAFASVILSKWSFPELNVNELPKFTENVAYSQSVMLANPQGSKHFQMGILVPDEFTYENDILAGTPTMPDDLEFGVLAVDSINLPGKIVYYANDKQTHPVRSNPRVLRYFPLLNSASTGHEEIMQQTIIDDKIIKVIRNGQLIIIRNGKEYNAMGF